MKFKATAFIAFTSVMFTCGQSDESVDKIPTLTRILEYPSELNENSGMTEFDGVLWNINDGGNSAVMYGYDVEKNAIKQKVVIKGATNIDWEDITRDEQHIYIGDFGNNLGDRRDLKIYIINKADLAEDVDTVSASGEIAFAWEDQTDFTPEENYTSWDCEAFVVMDDSLLLFTKNWKTNKTSLYTVPNIPGSYKAKFRKQYDVSGLVTSSVYREDTHELLLLGYHNYVPFIVIAPDFDLAGMSFAGSHKTEFADLFGTQSEGITYDSSGSVFVSCESSLLVHPSLFKLDY